MSEPSIEVRGVSKDFMLPHLRRNTIKSHFVNVFRQSRVMEVQHALVDIDFDVARGEFFGVIGRNGSGKSTLLKILAGIYQPSAGRVSTHGRLVPFIELGVGFNPELTGRENVYLNGALLGFAPPEVDEMYDDIVSFAELEGSMDQKLKNYSSGMQVRIAFSVATRARADVLLIDEVLAVGDVSFQRKCFDHFRALKKAGTTIVFVTHDMALVREFCDRVILIEDSRLVSEGSADAVADEYTRLFMPGTLDLDAGRPESARKKRWGPGDVRYTRVEVPDYLDSQGTLVLSLEAVAERSFDEVAYGFVINNGVGESILGMTSAGKKQRCRDVRAGERISLEWEIPNVFSQGQYEVDVTITDLHGLVVHDSWNAATAFTVVKDETTPYPVTPEMSLSISRDADQPARPASPG